MRNVYLGTSEFAAVVLRQLSESVHGPVLVVTPLDRPRGRGRRVQAPPVAEAARELEIDLHQTKSVNEPASAARILDARPEVGTVCAFGQLIGEPLLSRTPLLNVHPSLLPRWRGAAPIERAIMAGDPTTGVTVIRLVQALDAGPMALAETVAIGAEETHGELAQRLAELAGVLLVRALDQMAAGELLFTEQDDSASTYAEKIGPEERRLDPALTAAQLAAQVRALTPHIGASVELEGGTRLGVRAAHVAAPEIRDAVATAESSEDVDGLGQDSVGATRVPRLEPGQLSSQGDTIWLGAADRAFELSMVQPPGGRPMSAADYLRGNELASRLAATPAQKG